MAECEVCGRPVGVPPSANRGECGGARLVSVNCYRLGYERLRAQVAALTADLAKARRAATTTPDGEERCPFAEHDCLRLRTDLHRQGNIREALSTQLEATRVAEARAERLAKALTEIASSLERRQCADGIGHEECASIARAALGEG